MTPIRRLVLALLPLVAPLPVLAQTENVELLPNLVVTPDREPTPREKVTGTVSVITSDEMERRQLRTVADVLRSVPGVSVQQSGGPGTQTSIFLRGANANHTMILLDGMNIGDPSTPNGATDFAHFLTENLDRIEVVRGPMSTLSGSGAMGGVINMVTKKGQGALQGSAFFELGTRLQTSAGANAQGSAGRFNYNITAAGTYAPGESVVPPRFWPQNGYVDNDSYRNVTLGSRLGFEINDNAQFTWFSRYIDTQVKYDQIGLEDPNATGFTQQLYNRLQFDGSFLDDRWKPTVGIAYVSVYRHDQDFPSAQVPFPFTQDAYFSGRRLQADWKNQIALAEQFNFVGGIDYDKTWMYSNSDGAQQWGDASQTGIYGQLRATFFDSLTLTAGGRVDSHSMFGTATTWRVGATYLFRETDTQFRASYGTAFKAPSLFELYSVGLFCRGNPNLQPERSRGYEFGVEQGLFNGKVKAGVTYFLNSFENLIQCPPPFARQENVAHAQSEGFEMFLHMSPVKWLDLAFEYTFMLAKNVDNNTWLVRRPEDTFGARAEVRPFEGFRFGVGVNHVANRHDIDAMTGAQMMPAAYTLVRATAAYQVSKGAELFARAENILDRQYEEPEGFKAPNFQAFFGVKAWY